MDGNGEARAPMQILLVEDSPGDVRLTKAAFHNVNLSAQLHVAVDGIEAMSFLKQMDANNVPTFRPDLILRQVMTSRRIAIAPSG